MVQSKTLNNSVKDVYNEIYESGNSPLLTASWLVIVDKLAGCEGEVIQRLNTAPHNHAEKEEIKVDWSP